MPPLASVSIPAVRRPEPVVQIPFNKGKAPFEQKYKSRLYDKEPLPVKPSNDAPKNARIVGRVLDENGVTYQLRIGDVELNDVTVDEILDYVSALDLESYEHKQFEEEREVRKVIEAEAQAHRLEKIERRKERAKTKGTVFFQDTSGTNDETEGGDETSGGRGRARPTYKHLFKKVQIRRRRKRDPKTGELMPLSDEEDEEASSEEDEPVILPSSSQTFVTLDQLPKRRRRRRDKITGELIPLSPAAKPRTGIAGLEKKRQRRRRHPLTGELMPIGWRYDQHEASQSGKNQDDIKFRKLSISHEHDAKRQRIGHESSMSRSMSPIPTKAQLASQSSPTKNQTPLSTLKMTNSKAAVLDLLSTDDESEARQAITTMTGLKLLPKSPGSRLTSHRMLQPTTTTSESESSPEPEKRTSILRPHVARPKISSTSDSSTSRQPKAGKTSILNPSAAKESEASEDDLDEDEWFIQAILAHHMSDPKTHPPELGTQPVMLYHVKWEGFDEPTWEPEESFGDQSIVEEYRKRVGLGKDLSATAAPSVKAAGGVESTIHIAGTTGQDESDESDDEEYEVERVLDHHLSDPKTHPPELGKKAIMLYKIKWKGYTETSWEPASSFGEQDLPLRMYRKRMGLDKSHPTRDDDENSDVIMLD